MDWWLVLRVVIAYVLLVFALASFMGRCLEFTGPDAPEDRDDASPALPDGTPRPDPRGRSDDATHLSAVCALSASVARVGVGRAATPEFHVDQFTAERRKRLARLQDRRH